MRAGRWEDLREVLFNRRREPVAPVDDVVQDPRRLHWVKIVDPDAEVSAGAPNDDVRVLLPDDPRFDVLRNRLSDAGIPYRAVRYWVEQETVTTIGSDGRLGPLLTQVSPCSLVDRFVYPTGAVSGPAAVSARDAFDLVWQTHAPTEGPLPDPVPITRFVPASWQSYLPYPRFNPAQTEAVPVVLDDDGHLLVVAPTGAGKTVIGMSAALKTILGQRRKAAWLVPQRSLTDELDRELETWRGNGLRVERLSGEYSTDVERVRDADLWVATTEKFEAICRASSLRQALAEVGCLVVDEVHLLGDPVRGPVLEALLARVRGSGSPVRIVGLSATVANAEEIAAWLDARLVPIKWRPSRLTWQLPMIPASSDRAAARTARGRLAAGITNLVTAEAGSVLVFCGSKRNVRTTALQIAAERGADVRGIDPDDLERVYEVCRSARVGLHYRDWEHKRQAEQEFRARALDVLVATSTVAAGVNLPARAVVVRDTQVGLDEMTVSMVQQMFGRAGRVGAGETEGWAYLIVDEAERPAWQAKLVDGYTVTSRILTSLPDHVLAETVQGRISTLREAEAWWVQTLAHHQGSQDLKPLHRAVAFLAEADYLTVTGHASGDADVTPTALGLFTARMMVPTAVGYDLRVALESVPVPAHADDAEEALITAVAERVPQLAEAPVAEELRPLIARILQAKGHLRLLGRSRTFIRGGLAAHAPYAPGDLAKATLLIAANSPRAFATASRAVAGVPGATLFPILEEAPRYLHWIGAQGVLGTAHPWCAIVAADLSRRIRWRRCAPGRGSGRLLWMCEQMATPAHADKGVPAMWNAATSRGLAAPDWPTGPKPSACQLDDIGYTTLLRDRVTGTTITEDPLGVTATCPSGSVLTTWNGRAHAHLNTVDGKASQPYPNPAADEPAGAPRGAAVFTRRGDYQGTGWLGRYTSSTRAEEPRR